MTGDAHAALNALRERFDPDRADEWDVVYDEVERLLNDVDRLRAQNKASSDEWHKRTAKMQSDLHGLKALMAEASDMNRNQSRPSGNVVFGLSQYGNAALAVALKEADEARANLDAAQDAMNAERRARNALESQMRNLRRTIHALSESGEKAS